MMMHTWQSIGGRRHLVLAGRVVCGTIGVPSAETEIPCQACVEGVLDIARSVFPGR
jgi:hypothetical protein